MPGRWLFGDDDVGAQGDRLGERLAPVTGLVDAPVPELQVLGVQVARILILVDEQGESRNPEPAAGPA